MAIQNIGGYNTNIITEDFIRAGDGIAVEGDTISLATPQYPFQYFGARSLNLSMGAALSTIPLLDGTTIQGVTMDYSTGGQVSIETVALNDFIPRVTIFWLATAAVSNDTVFATNSGTKTAMPRTSPFLWTPNNRVNTAHLFNDKYLYIGGAFTALSSTRAQHRFGIVDLSAGQSAGIFGTTGRPLTAVTMDIGISPNSVNFVGGNYVDLSATANLNMPLPVAPPATKHMKWNIQFYDGAVNDIKRFGEFMVFGGTFTYVTINAYDTGLNKMVAVNVPCGRLLIVSLSAVEGAESYRPRFHTFDLNNQVTTIEKNGDDMDGEGSLFIGGFFTNKVIKVTTIEEVLFDARYKTAAVPYTKSSVSSQYSLTVNSIACKGLIKIDYNKDTGAAIKDKFTIDYIFNNNASSSILNINTSTDAGIYVLKYINGIIYAGGGHSAFETGTYGKYMTVHKAVDGNTVNGRGKMYDYLEDVDTKNKWSKFSFNNKVHTIEYNNNTLYTGGAYTTISKIGTTKVYNNSYITAFDFTNVATAEPTVYENWNPFLNGYVSNIQVDDDAVYVIGAFNKVGASSRLRCAALSKPSNFGNALALDWRADLGGGASNRLDKILLIPNTNPLSGIVLTGNFTTINQSVRYNVARVIKFNQTIVPFEGKTVEWELYGKIVSNQTNINIETEDAIKASTTTIAYPTQILNTTSFPINSATEKIFEGIQSGLPLRIIVKRKANSGTYNSSGGAGNGRAWIVGARIDYDTKALYDSYLDSLNQPLGILKQPVSLSATVGGTATLSAVLSGSEPIDYNWFVNDSPNAEANSNVYYIASVTESDEGNYRLEASNAKNTVTTDEAILYINPVGFTTQPAGSSLVYGTSAVMFVTTSGFNVKYEWYKNNALINGASDSTYTFASAVDSDEGFYKVVATNFFRSVTSNNAFISINNLQITVNLPADVTIPIGGNTNLYIEYVGRPPLGVQWLSGTSFGNVTTPITTGNNLEVGYYKAVVTNGVGASATSNTCYVHY